jgi:hypothetical protein
VILVGLSQGGMASMILSLMTEPTAAVIASGFTTLIYNDYYADINQIIIPDWTTKFSQQNTYDIIDRKSTYYLFSYGENDNYYYALDRQDSITYNVLRGTNKVSLSTTNYGHTFPLVPVMRDFMTSNIERPMATFSRTTECDTFTDEVAVSVLGELPITFSYQRDNDPAVLYTMTQPKDTLRGLAPGRYIFSNPTNAVSSSVYHSAVIVRDLRYTPADEFSIESFGYNFASRDWHHPSGAESVNLSFINSWGATTTIPANMEIVLQGGTYKTFIASVGSCVAEIPIDLELERPYFSAYPNPATSMISIEINMEPSSTSEITAYFYDLTGRVEGTYSLGYGKNDIDISHMTPGMHVIKLQNSFGNMPTQLYKFLKI